MTFGALLDDETLQAVCSENGYEAAWDASAGSVVLEDAMGKHYFKPGLKPREIALVLRQNPTAEGLQGLIFDAVAAEDVENF